MVRTRDKTTIENALQAERARLEALGFEGLIEELLREKEKSLIEHYERRHRASMTLARSVTRTACDPESEARDATGGDRHFGV